MYAVLDCCCSWIECKTEHCTTGSDLILGTQHTYDVVGNLTGVLLDILQTCQR